MNFLSWQFVGFYAITYLFFWATPGNEAKKWMLIAASYFFYGAWDWWFNGLMLGVTLNAFAAGWALERYASQRRLILVASIATSLGVLVFFKYATFLYSNLATVGQLVCGLESTWCAGWSPLFLIILPVGISFYTFHAISYTVDIYRWRISGRRSFADVALYIAFFPILVAGPIVRASTLMPQLARESRFWRAQQISGLRLFAIGVLYKTVADTLAPYCDPIFADAPRFSTGPVQTLDGILAFYGQIYFDFAGYSGMAIGIARTLGYRIPRNFNFPYRSASVTEFWRRWHISLSSWLRDYLYIPLGGSRAGVGRQLLNLMIVMVLGGLWHGASWTFVIWGGLHGLGLSLHKIWLLFRPRRLGWLWQSPFWWCVGVLVTQIWVIVAWIFFRATSFGDAIAFISSVFRYPEAVNGRFSAFWIVVRSEEHTSEL